MIHFKARRGQFLVLTAFLVVVILSSAIVLSYKRVRENSDVEPITISSKLAEINTSLSNILSFTVGYYGSLIQVTGNVTWAKEKTENYLESGLQNIARSNIDWGTSFTLNSQNIHTDWFVKNSVTEGDMTITYNMTSLGLSGVVFKTYVSLKAEILETA
jgi:hypothetical protein